MAGGFPIRALLVEDNPGDVRLMREMLADADGGGCELRVAERLAPALQALAAGSIDIVLLDLNLPDSGGLETFAAVHDGAPRTPVVVLTALADDALALETVRLGAQDYLVKGSIDGQVLIRAMRYAIERQRAEEALQRLNAELEERVRRRTAELEAANRDLEAFSFSVSHDLRAPLRAISNFAQIIAEDYAASLDERGRHYVDNIVLAGNRMDQLIRDLLAYSRLGRSAIKLAPVPLREVVESAARSLEPRIRELAASLEIHPDLPLVEGDPTLLSQVFTNLLDNALTYRQADKPPAVAVGWRRESDHCIATVADKGIGIAAEHHERIFEVFQRLHSQDRYPGTGIGLAIVKRSVELMGGRLWVESEPGRGSTFFLSLKCAPGRLTGNSGGEP